MFTPAPWKVAEETEKLPTFPKGEYMYKTRIFSLDDAEFAPANAYADSEEKSRNIAQLIASAPIHHEVLLMVSEWLTAYCYDASYKRLTAMELLEEVDHTIQKATGDT